MASKNALDLIKRLATDDDFRKRLNDMNSQDARTLLATEGFADVMAADIRAVTPQSTPQPSIAAWTDNAGSVVVANSAAGFGVPANASAGFGTPASAAAGFGVPANASAGFGAPATMKVAG
ncbi:hypothetical protein TSH100_15765 [Azospirillum sp. TSH100]|uniref:hypothetical protein n=1 Tax=Azospirillum sp. TSH100 TaxID=652764 RepID=UPI000D619E5C|nr:hypothetical protein [Azospirillum sp. TSH100]PWC85379.1 hypothetical protein TSH100_15765 [Azospirillum sp. TSH100]QCG86482.1 hypothetical protein E6C72_01285 [Azospirillum sp. TSH100]